MRPNRVALLLLLPLAISGVGCPRRVPSPAEALERAADGADDPEASARQRALGGFHAMLVSSDFKLAKARFESAVEKDSAEPYALYGLMLIARRQARLETMLTLALDLCERAPTHPLASAAAREALDLAGVASSSDDTLLTRIPAALAAGAVGDTAYLLRSAMASIFATRDEWKAHAEVMATLGTPTRAHLVGPFSPHHLLTFDEPTAIESSGALAGEMKGPYGPVQPRLLQFPDGRISLSGEGDPGDGYLLVVDFELAGEPALHLLRSVTSSPHKLYLDGALALHSRGFERSGSSVNVRAVKLSPGRHRVVVRLARGDRSGNFAMAFPRLDGKPATLTFLDAQGAPPQPWGEQGLSALEAAGAFPRAQDLVDALTPEVGVLLAQLIAVRDGMGRDRDGVKRLTAELSKTLGGPAFLALRAEVALGDRTVSAKVGRGRATGDLETTLEKDTGDVQAQLLRAGLALEDGRNVEASEWVKKARAAHSPAGFQVLLLQARIEQALGVDAQADASAQEAIALLPGLCDALLLRYDLARRRDAATPADELLKQLARCPGQVGRAADHARSRGDLEKAAQLLERALQADPGELSIANQLVGHYLSLRRFDDAVKLLNAQRKLWPRNPSLPRKLGEVLDLAGKPKEALAAREASLALDGGDLELRRMVERAKTGKEPLQEHAVDGKAAIAAYEAKPGSEDAAAVYILDAAVVKAYPDGSTLDRIHIIQKALDQSGVSEIAEVNLPQGAYVLALRTLKPDGTALEPESIEGKEAISLPGVQVGDYVEYEYLMANGSRGPAQPGFTSASFYYQIARQPNYWSTYKVIAPKGMGMSIDSHNLPPLSPKIVGNEEQFIHDERRVPAYLPEPNGPASPNEYLPFVSVGAGATGNDGLVAAYSDAFLDRGKITFEVEQFARTATEGQKGLDAVKALYSAVHQKLSGRDGGLTFSASESAAQDRGSRLWLLKAGLEAIGIPARLAAIRTFSTDPTPYKFPNESLLPYICLRVDLSGIEDNAGQTGGPVWLDTAIRFAPFGELLEQATGELETYLFPEPGRPLEKLKSPPRSAEKGKTIELKLKLSEDGKLTGSGQETYQGFEAAQLAEALESLTPDQRDQALQSAISRYFGGATLTSLKLELKREVGAEVKVRYELSAPRFGRPEGGKLVFGGLTFPAQLGRRYVQLGTRTTPLYVEGTEVQHTSVELELPSGYRLSQPVAEVQSKGGRYGHFMRREKQEGRTVRVEEELRVEMARIPPRDYEQFGHFAGEVDLIQTRDLLAEKK
jgi:tetratricopeptide (TPR) repeat protein